MRQFHDPEVRVSVELHDNMPIMHCAYEDSKWNMKELMKCYMLWGKIISDLVNMGFITVYAAVPDEKVAKFARLFDFEITEHGIEMDGHGIVPLYMFDLRGRHYV